MEHDESTFIVGLNLCSGLWDPCKRLYYRMVCILSYFSSSSDLKCRVVVALTMLGGAMSSRK